MRGGSIAIVAVLLVCGTACSTLPKGTQLVTCKPIIRQGSVGWRDGGGKGVEVDKEAVEDDGDRVVEHGFAKYEDVECVVHLDLGEDGEDGDWVHS